MGGAGARKEDGRKAPYTPKEERFLKSAIKTLIHRAAEVEDGPRQDHAGRFSIARRLAGPARFCCAAGRVLPPGRSGSADGNRTPCAAEDWGVLPHRLLFTGAQTPPAALPLPHDCGRAVPCHPLRCPDEAAATDWVTGSTNYMTISASATRLRIHSQPMMLDMIHA